MEIGRGDSKLRRMNRRFFLAARQRVQAHSTLAPQRQFKIQNSRFGFQESGIKIQNL